MVQTRQQIEDLIQRNIQILPRFDIYLGENIVSFRLSNIIAHLERFRVNEIIESMVEYNNTHDVKFPDQDIENLRDFDNQVNRIISAMIRYAHSDIYIRSIILDRVTRHVTYLSRRIVDLYNNISEETEISITTEIVSRLEDKEFHFLRDTIGEVVERNLTNDDDNYDSILFDRITVENIVIDI
jgi:hypothetical protein